MSIHRNPGPTFGEDLWLERKRVARIRKALEADLEPVREAYRRKNVHQRAKMLEEIIAFITDK